jgi:hypothetical protein
VAKDNRHEKRMHADLDVHCVPNENDIHGHDQNQPASQAESGSSARQAHPDLARCHLIGTPTCVVPCRDERRYSNVVTSTIRDRVDRRGFRTRRWCCRAAASSSIVRECVILNQHFRQIPAAPSDQEVRFGVSYYRNSPRKTRLIGCIRLPPRPDPRSWTKR